MDWIREMPWWVPTGLGLVGIILLWTGNNRQERRLKRTGLALLGAAMVTGALGYFLESDREIVVGQTRRLVAAVENRDWRTMESLLHPEISVLAWRGQEDLVKGAKKYTVAFGIRRVWIAGLEAGEPRPTVTVIMRVLADLRNAVSFPTDWELVWERTEQGWLLLQVNPLGSPVLGGGQGVDQYFRTRP